MHRHSDHQPSCPRIRRQGVTPRWSKLMPRSSRDLQPLVRSAKLLAFASRLVRKAPRDGAAPLRTALGRKDTMYRESAFRMQWRVAKMGRLDGKIAAVT